jgi:phosphoribosylaminoimidazole-succinocarboxamide synthase
MKKLPPLIYRGSVKNVRGKISDKTLLFEYSDRFSVFDWGEMPDAISEKGKTLAVMGKIFFRYLENKESWIHLFSEKEITENFDPELIDFLKTHPIYKKFCQEGVYHHAVLDESVEWNSPFMKVKSIQVHRPKMIDYNSYDYSEYQKSPFNCLVPLEVIFRLGLSKDNSLSKRLGSDLKSWQQFGFNVIPASNQMLRSPVIDFSTKLERGDRYISYQEAKNLAGLNTKEWNNLVVFAKLIGLNLYVLHKKMGFELWDGKIEVAFVEGADGVRNFMLVDSIGIDELRLIVNGKSFSKEFLREVYKESAWFKNLEASKLESKKTGEDFKSICLNKYHSLPEALPKLALERAVYVYKTYCNELSQVSQMQLPFAPEYSLKKYIARFL